MPARWSPPPPVERPRRPRPRAGRWTLVATAVQVGVLLAVPVVLGATVGFFEMNPKQAELLAPVGSEAHLLLEPFPDDHLIVEIAYQASIGPPPGNAVSTLFDQINRTCEKSSISLDLHPFTSSATDFGLSDLLSIESSVRQHWPVWGTMSLFFLYLNGYDAAASSALGEAYRGSSIAIFQQAIISTTFAHVGGVTAHEVDATVMVHELGHDLGLVGTDGYAANEDPHHLGHSSDPTDVMYWGIDTSAYIGGLTGSVPPTNFSSADLADLRNVRADVIPYEVLPWAVLGASLLASAVVVVRARPGRPPAPGPPA